MNDLAKCNYIDDNNYDISDRGLISISKNRLNYLSEILCCLSTLESAEMIKKSGISNSDRCYFGLHITQYARISFIRKHRDELIRDEKYAKIFINVNKLPDDVIFYINHLSGNDDIMLFTNNFIDKDCIDVVYKPVKFWCDKKIICLLD